MDGKGAKLMVMVADELRAPFGSYGNVARVTFLIGAWGAVFSSLLGVWQSIPYLFVDLVDLTSSDLKAPNDARPKIDTNSREYQRYLLALGVIPAIGLYVDFVAVQMVNAVIGALFIPMLAAALLVLNGKPSEMRSHRNSWLTIIMLVATLVFFSIYGLIEINAAIVRLQSLGLT